MSAKGRATGTTIALVLIASIMLQTSLNDRQVNSAAGWLQLCVVCGIAGWLWIARGSDMHDRFRAYHRSSFFGWAGLAIAWDLAMRSVIGAGEPYEVQLGYTLRNLMIGAATVRGDLRTHNVAAVASCFLVLFSFLWSINVLVVTIAFAYVLTGMWWLIRRHWHGVSQHIANESEQAIPKVPTIGAIIVCLGTMTGVIYSSNNESTTTALRGVFPSSGGTRWHDPSAFGGVGDGDQIVSADKEAHSFGPVESELMLESEMPSLYDVFNEMSDVPPKPKSTSKQRTIPLSPSQTQPNHAKTSQTQQSQREFSAVRRRPQSESPLADRKSLALLQVAGRVPLHLGLYAYDTWDGRTLTSASSSHRVQLRFDPSTSASDSQRWVKLHRTDLASWLDYPERHELRILNLKTERVPSPPNVNALHVDKIHTEDLFVITDDGMLAMDMEFIPQLSVLHVESLRAKGDANYRLKRTQVNQEFGDHKVTDLAREWTRGISEGMGQVDAICRGLREHCAYDPSVNVPEDSVDAVHDFLFRTRCGPDYLFATTAAVMLRSLGYETRVISGFYARPEHFDRRSRITSVFKEDAHFWVEILAQSDRLATSTGDSASGVWITLDPTPGFDVLYAPQSLWSMVARRAVGLWQITRRQPLPALFVLASLIVVWRYRCAVLDHVGTFIWHMWHRWSTSQDLRQEVCRTVRLLEWRARLRGCRPARGTPIGRWQLLAGDPPSADARQVARFTEIASWALYGDGVNPAYSRTEILAVCRSSAALAFRTSSRMYPPWITQIGKDL